MLRAVKAVRRVVKRGSADRGQEDRQLEFAQVKRELQDQYKPYSGKKSSDNDTTQYTTSKRIQKNVLTRDRLRSLFDRYKWWKDSELEVLFKDFPCVIATLITFGWKGWKDFGTLFFNRRDAKKNPLRCDNQLPFTEDDLQFLEEEPIRRAFLQDQYIYKPVVLVEDEHQTFTLNQRLPFVHPPLFIEEGSYGRILSIEVDDYQLKYTREKAPGGQIATVKTRWALKEITKRESWVQECEIQRRLKLCSTRHRSLLLSFSSFERGHQLGILYPHAHLNLAEFLRGKYAEFPGKSLFKPEHIFHQMAMLAEAFHWMHKQLSLDGDNAKCYHHDFKATNVLVFWVEGKDLAGEWKIIDFGLGHFSPHRARPTSRLLDVPPESSDASSIIASSRDPGPNSAPEMHMGGQVSASADRYSYGTVYAELLAFFIGGPDKVRELTMQRQTNSDTCFWMKTDTGNFILKPSVDQWLGKITMIPGTSQPFVKAAVKYVRGLLDPNRNTRMKSVEMEQTAKKMEKIAKNLSFAWIVYSFETNGVIDTSPVPRRSDSVSIVASRVNHTEAIPPNLMKRILGFLRQKRSLCRETVDKDKNVGRWSTLHSTAFEPKPPKFAHYHSVNVPQGTYQTRIGAKSQITSFCSPAIVYLYDIRFLFAHRIHWSASQDMLSQNPSSSLLPVWHFNAPADQLWKSVLMAGNFIACWSCSYANLGLDKVYVYEYMPSSRDQFGEPKYDITLGKNCLDVQLSSRGHLVLIYEDHIELRNRNGRLFPEGRASPSVKKASFSNDGDTLCVWRRAAENHMDYWHFFTIYDDKMDVYSHWKYYSKPLRPQDDVALGGQEIKDVILVPFQSGTRFLACDEIGHMVYLDTSGEERLQQSNDRCEGAYMALPCAEGSVALLQRYDEDPLSSVSIAIHQTGADVQHVELRTRWASIGPSEHGLDCGAATFTDGSGIGLIASFPDGTLVRLGS